VADDFIRILSDLHYGERCSRIRAPSQLGPLMRGPGTLVLNGDTLDTRRGPDPAHNARCLAEVRDYFSGAGPAVTYLTGNHDPDMSECHFLDLAGGRVFVTHGDILFQDIVPWGMDAPALGRLVEDGLAALGGRGTASLRELAAVYRRAAAAVGQRHQAERNGPRYVMKTARDSVWPPWRLLRVLKAWRDMPALAGELAARHRPGARFVVTGHTHRPGVWRRQNGLVVINTGSFCRPFLGVAVDIHPGRLSVMRIREHGGEFIPGGEIAAFPLMGC